MLKDGLMKKIALLTLALLVSLPSCRRDKSDTSDKRQRTEQRANVYSSSNQSEFVAEDEDLDDDLSTLFDMDEVDVDETTFDYDDDAGLLVDEYSGYEDNYMDEENSDIAWIDTQIEDELKPLYFEFNKSTLNDSQKQALTHDIDQVKQLIADAGDSKAIVVAEGHTCQEGTPEYNIGLSENRAKSVADLLVSAGIERDVIKVVGRGKENPVVEGKTRAERAPNRRVELRVIYT